MLAIISGILFAACSGISRKDYGAVLGQLDAVKAERDSLREERDSLQAESDSFSDRLTIANEQIKSLGDDAASRNSRIEGLTADVNDLEQQNDTLSGQVEALLEMLSQFEMEFPEDGEYHNYTDRSSIAPFEVLVEESDPSYYYIVLKNIETGTKDASLFLHPGTSKEIEVPVGEYEMYISTGTTWYGDEHAFGTSGSYSKMDETFHFYLDDSYANGHSITLYGVIGGNISEDPVDWDEFPQ
jgi:cell division protein FtsB